MATNVPGAPGHKRGHRQLQKLFSLVVSNTSSHLIAEELARVAVFRLTWGSKTPQAMGRGW